MDMHSLETGWKDSLGSQQCCSSQCATALHRHTHNKVASRCSEVRPLYSAAQPLPLKGCPTDHRCMRACRPSRNSSQVYIAAHFADVLEHHICMELAMR